MAALSFRKDCIHWPSRRERFGSNAESKREKGCHQCKALYLVLMYELIRNSKIRKRCSRDWMVVGLCTAQAEPAIYSDLRSAFRARTSIDWIDLSWCHSLAPAETFPDGPVDIDTKITIHLEAAFGGICCPVEHNIHSLLPEHQVPRGPQA